MAKQRSKRAGATDPEAEQVELMPGAEAALDFARSCSKMIEAEGALGAAVAPDGSQAVDDEELGRRTLRYLDCFREMRDALRAVQLDIASQPSPAARLAELAASSND